MKRAALLLFAILLGIALAEVSPQEPHYKEGEHNQDFSGQHDELGEIVKAKVVSCSG